MTPTRLRTIRLTDADWKALQDIAWWIVPDSAMLPDARKDAGRVAQLLRMIASGQLTVTEKPTRQE